MCSEASNRAVVVSFGTRIKVFNLTVKNSNKQDLIRLKEDIIDILKEDRSYEEFGISKPPTIHDVILLYYSEIFFMEVELDHNTEIKHGDKFKLSLRPTLALAEGLDNSCSAPMLDISGLTNVSVGDSSFFNVLKGVDVTQEHFVDVGQHLHRETISCELGQSLNYVADTSQGPSSMNSAEPVLGDGQLQQSSCSSRHFHEKRHRTTSGMPVPETSPSIEITTCSERSEQTGGFLIANLAPPTLPPQLQDCATERKKALANIQPLTLFYARHLFQHNQRPSKGEYNHYAKCCVDLAPGLRDSRNVCDAKGNIVYWSTFKDLPSKSVCNMRYYQKHSQEIKNKRLFKEKPVSVTADENDASSEEKSYSERRVKFDSLKSNCTSEITSNIPEYLQITVILADFIRLNNSQNFASFQKNFDLFMQALVLFFKEDTSMKNDPHLLVMAGTQAVAKKHQKTSSFPPLITISHVGDNHESAVAPHSPHLILFYDTDENLAVAFIDAGNGVTYVLDECISSSRALKALLAVYYVFHLSYPAPYGLLGVIDCLCLQSSLEIGNSLSIAKAKRMLNVTSSKFVDSLIEEFKTSQPIPAVIIQDSVQSGSVPVVVSDAPTHADTSSRRVRRKKC